MRKTKTHEEFLNEVKEKRSGEFEILGKYVNAKTKILVRHNCEKCNYHEWKITPDNLLRGNGCPVCGREKTENARRKTHEEFIKEVEEKYGNEYKVLEKYKGDSKKILIKHNNIKCNGNEWYIRPGQLLSGHGCPVCGGTMKKTTEEFKQEIYEKYGDEYTVLGEYINSNTKILIKHNCKECNYYEYKVIPYNLLGGRGCPVCGGHMQKNTENFKNEIFEKYGDEYEILGEYINAQTKIKVKHNSSKCNYHEWYVKPNNLLNNKTCPVCAGKSAKLGVNTIWDTDRWMVDLGVSEEDAKRCFHGSGKKIIVTCPNCGREKKISINQIYNNKSIGCLCNDGRSYPEKFVGSFLENLELKYKKEYSPKWIGKKRYDFYLKDYSCIIETHGEQHYEKAFKNLDCRNLEEEQANDKYKKEMALNNGIKHYIELDCRESNLEWIKNSILNSKLNDLFDLSNINWNKCAEFANKNIVKEVCEYWNNKRDGETTSDLANMLNLNRNTIVNYLKKGTKLGWCKYDSKKEREKGRSKKGKNAKKVEIFKDNESLGIFESCHELERQSEELFGVKLFQSNIGHVCLGRRKSHKGFTFKYVTESGK
ncbi:hypothetical protein LI014_02150 [Clostridium perfringens]|uniref:hypothetical protein n=1 Tax=Clostridium perfringens TaxID=1502 RepID=UPI002246A4DE|nr:hypothetical protein [Clostridium perfringens]MCX0396187.1 hypothetical protein [Clostridium perfringens]